MFAPTRRRLPRRPGPALSRGTLGYLKLVDHRISQVPGESIPYLCPALGPRPVRRPSPCRLSRCSPHLWDGEDTHVAVISRLNHAASVSAAYASRACVTAPACKARFRLVASLCREGVEPSGFHRKVSVRYIELPPFPGLSWRDRKTTSHRKARCIYMGGQRHAYPVGF